MTDNYKPAVRWPTAIALLLFLAPPIYMTVDRPIAGLAWLGLAIFGLQIDWKQLGHNADERNRQR